MSRMYSINSSIHFPKNLKIINPIRLQGFKNNLIYSFHWSISFSHQPMTARRQTTERRKGAGQALSSTFLESKRKNSAFHSLSRQSDCDPKESEILVGSKRQDKGSDLALTRWLLSRSWWENICSDEKKRVNYFWNRQDEWEWWFLNFLDYE